jgi:hypothetical protein
MLTVPEKITAVSHPLVASMYLKKDFHGSDPSEDVLVIETNFTDKNGGEITFADYLMELLADLPEIQEQAEQRVGHIDRVDIRA